MLFFASLVRLNTKHRNLLPLMIVKDFPQLRYDDPYVIDGIVPCVGQKLDKSRVRTATASQTYNENFPVKIVYTEPTKCCTPAVSKQSTKRYCSQTMDNDADQTYIKLISADGTEIFLERRIALQVETIRAMLEGNFRESEEGGKLF